MNMYTYTSGCVEFAGSEEEGDCLYELNFTYIYAYMYVFTYIYLYMNMYIYIRVCSAHWIRGGS